MSFFVWFNYYQMEPIEQFKNFPYKAQSPITLDYIKFRNEADVWTEVEKIAKLANTSKKRTIGHILFDLVPLFASPDIFFKNWMVDIMNEFHWIKEWNVSPGNLNDISAFRLDCWTVIENELTQIKNKESKNGK